MKVNAFAGQLVFRFRPGREKTFASYYAAGNALVVHALLDIVRCLSRQPRRAAQLYLWGDAMTGKSHLLQALCCEAGKHGARCAYLPLLECVDYGCESLTGLTSFDLLCLDDVDVVLPRHDWQQALFHLVNQARIGTNVLVMAGEQNPAHARLHLKDLASRLVWGAVYRLNPLPDEDKAFALHSIARQLQFELPASSVDYLLKHYSRDLGYLTALLKFLRHAAQQSKCRLTIPFIRHAIKGFVRESVAS